MSRFESRSSGTADTPCPSGIADVVQVDGVDVVAPRDIGRDGGEMCARRGIGRIGEDLPIVVRGAAAGIDEGPFRMGVECMPRPSAARLPLALPEALGNDPGKIISGKYRREILLMFVDIRIFC